MNATTYTVSELASTVGQVISRAFPDEVWVTGEIRDLSRARSGHVYFNLVDAESPDTPQVVLPVTLFASDKIAVNRVLTRSGAVRMTDGVEVRIRGSVTHYAARGTVQLRMTWIDPEFTLGKLAVERERLIKSLSEKGLLERNRAVPLPLVPLRVGLITSAGSAAHADFFDELKRSGYAWKVQLFDARVQGVDAIADVVSGLGSLANAGLDVIAVVRGGGAKTDLAAFDSEEIARAIAQCPIPVLTGIGHEIDVSVADLAARSFKTPTACAAGLVSGVTAFVDRLDRLAADTSRSVRNRLRVARHQLETATARLSRSSVAVGRRAEQTIGRLADQVVRRSLLRLRRERDDLQDLHTRIARVSLRQLDSTEATLDRISVAVGGAAVRATTAAAGHLDDLEHRLSLLDPQRLFAKGWSITRTADGELVATPTDVDEGTVLHTTVGGGEIESVVTNTEEVTGG